jgi:hypothetical protein
MNVSTRLLPAALCLTCLGFAPAIQAQFLFGRLVPDPPAVEANAPSADVDVSVDGRTIVFASSANNWFPGQQPGDAIIAVDLVSGAIQSRSRTSVGVPLNGNSYEPVVSGDGRYVVFTTQASNLDVGVATSGAQIVRKDRDSGALVLVSASAAGVPASGSASGQARYPSVSADGRFVAFSSDASNLVAGDLAGTEDIFVKDLQTGAIEAVSRDANGAFTASGVTFQTSHSISADGRFVLFQSSAANIVPGIGSGTIRVYLRDRQAGTTELVSRNSAGDAAGSQSDIGAISPDGRFVSFRSFATNLGASGGGSRVFVRDRATSTTTPVPLPTVDGVVATGCRESDVSDAGTVLISCFFALPVRDQVLLHVPGAAGMPFLVSSDAADQRGDDASGATLAVDASGLSMVFESIATNLVPEDGNGTSDVFVLVAPEVLERIFADGFEE